MYALDLGRTLEGSDKTCSGHLDGSRRQQSPSDKCAKSATLLVQLKRRRRAVRMSCK